MKEFVSTPSILIKLCLCVIGCNVFYYYCQNALWESINLSADFHVYYSAAQTIWSGHPELLYDVNYYYETVRAVGPYNYPPFFAFALAPFTLLSFSVLKPFWLGFNQLLLLAAVGLVWKETRSQDVWLLVFLILACMFYGPIIANTHWANINALIWLTMITGWWAYKNNRPVLSGCVLALGAVIKLAPVVLIAYFLYQRAYRVVLSANGALGVFLLFPILFVDITDIYTAWYSERMVEMIEVGLGKAGTPFDQSIFGFFQKLAGQGILNVSLIQPLSIFIIIALIAASFAVCSTQKLRPDDATFDLEYAVISLLPLLGNTIVITPVYTMAMTSYMLLIYYLIRTHVEALWLYIALGVSYTLVSFGAFGGSAFSSGIMVFFQSPKLYGILLLWGILVYLLYSIRSGGKIQPSPDPSFSKGLR